MTETDVGEEAPEFIPPPPISMYRAYCHRCRVNKEVPGEGEGVKRFIDARGILRASSPCPDCGKGVSVQLGKATDEDKRLYPIRTCNVREQAQKEKTVYCHRCKERKAVHGKKDSTGGHVTNDRLYLQYSCPDCGATLSVYTRFATRYDKTKYPLREEGGKRPRSKPAPAAPEPEEEVPAIKETPAEPPPPERAAPVPKKDDQQVTTLKKLLQDRNHQLSRMMEHEQALAQRVHELEQTNGTMEEEKAKLLHQVSEDKVQITALNGALDQLQDQSNELRKKKAELLEDMYELQRANEALKATDYDHRRAIENQTEKTDEEIQELVIAYRNVVADLQAVEAALHYYAKRVCARCPNYSSPIATRDIENCNYHSIENPCPAKVLWETIHKFQRSGVPGESTPKPRAGDDGAAMGPSGA